jgi:hypothetical protein
MVKCIHCFQAEQVGQCCNTYFCIRLPVWGSQVAHYYYMLPTIQLPVGTRFSAPVQTSPGAHPTFYTMGTRSFPGVKWPGRGVDHPPPSSTEVKETVELYLYSPSGPSWPVLGWPLPLPTIQHITVKWSVYTCRNRELICETGEERLRLKTHVCRQKNWLRSNSSSISQ